MPDGLFRARFLPAWLYIELELIVDLALCLGVGGAVGYTGLGGTACPWNRYPVGGVFREYEMASSRQSNGNEWNRDWKTY